MTLAMSNKKTLEAVTRISQAIKDIQAGKMVVMVNDENRENEGDLVYAASLSTPKNVNFMGVTQKVLFAWLFLKTLHIIFL